MISELAGQPWLTRSQTRAVIAALEAVGGPDCVRFVGGCVRNSLMGQRIDDVDLATRLRPEIAMQALTTAGLKVVPTGLAHGTITAVSDKVAYEITSLRRDVETDGRRAVVAFTDDWAEDAGRRDFRLNALYADAAGEVFDPTGQGIDDARAGRIVFVGDPETRIREDYLRILRFFRFFAWYGRGEPDAGGLASCAALAGGMGSLSAERVSKELLKLLAAPDPGPALVAMREAGVLAQVLGPVPDPSLSGLRAMVGISADPVLRLSMLLASDGAGIEVAARRLRLSNPVRDRLIAAAPTIDLDMTDREARAALYRAGPGAFEDRVRRAEAEGNRPGDGARLLQLADRWIIPRLPLGGRQVAAAGIAPGPDTGRALKAFETQWIAEDFPADDHAERLKTVIAGLKVGPGSGG